MALALQRQQGLQLGLHLLHGLYLDHAVGYGHARGQDEVHHVGDRHHLAHGHPARRDEEHAASQDHQEGPVVHEGGQGLGAVQGLGGGLVLPADEVAELLLLSQDLPYGVECPYDLVAAQVVLHPVQIELQGFRIPLPGGGDPLLQNVRHRELQGAHPCHDEQDDRLHTD